MTKSQVAEKIHDTILERIIFTDIEITLLSQAIEKMTHDSKGKILADERMRDLTAKQEENEKVLRYIEKRIAGYKFDESKNEQE
jgi:hypothetical protein